MSTAVTAPWLNSGFLTANHRLAAATLRQKVIAILADRVSIRRFLTYAGDGSGMGSAVLRSLYSTMGASIAMQSLTEVEAMTPVDLTTNVRDITLGRHGVEAHESWLARVTERDGIDMSLDVLASLIAETWEAEFMDSIATLVATASSTVGTSGVDASMDDIYDATYLFDLQDGAEGPLIGLLHGRQIADIKESKRGEPAEWIRDEAQVAFKAPGYQGTLLDIAMFKSNRITSDGTDRKGAIFTPRAIAYSVATSGVARVATGLSQWAFMIPEIGLICDFGADQNTAKQKFFAQGWYGAAIGEEGQKEIVGVVTDA